MKGTISHSTSQRNLCGFKPRLPLSPRSPGGKCPLFPPLKPTRSSVSHTLLIRAHSEELQSLYRYSLMRTIGTGSFSRVRVAVEKLTNEVVAIKIISKSMVLRRNQLNHILEERKLLASLQHPFIVEFKGAFQDPYFLYFVMEFVQGGDLYGLLVQQGAIEAYDAKVYISEIFCGLAYLHSKHVVYRDLKPENILLTSSGHIKLADLGFAKETHEKTYTLCGTPQYLAPEMISREGHDQQCDWWAMGVLLYEMLIGTAPFDADSPYGLYEEILTAEVQFPLELPREVRALIGILLVKDPKKRGNERQIRASAYFAGVKWDQVEQFGLQPMYRPRVKNSFDTSCFDKYEENDLPVDEKKPTAAALFSGF